jgi:hypothetical protein
MVTIEIKENSKQAKAFIALAKTLSFVRFKDAEKTKTPNSETKKAFSDTDKGVDLTSTKSHEDLLEKLYS